MSRPDRLDTSAWNLPREDLVHRPHLYACKARLERIFACLLKLNTTAENPQKKMSAPCKFAPAADATNHATTTDEQTASASPIMDMNIARTAQRFLLFPLAKGRANDSGASNRSRSVCEPGG
ncbi:hypothetical protein PCANC_20498 [Puccinia coronata f. sp. avenae]|uniref:Uncharacterized protein n=1 Tax=Puccinia coronata f. sp. avenae TaxID=200324 RepID=A0A2N5SQA0_9BASI|nr:hypothetical protein PCANC_20498 [Puccinia coronata f. sp. avenae]